MVSTVDESAPSSSLVGAIPSSLCSTVTTDPSVILPHLPSFNLSEENTDQGRFKLLSNDRGVLEETEIHSLIYDDTHGSVVSKGMKVSVGRENVSSEDVIRKQSSASTDDIPEFSVDVNCEVNSSESHSQQTEMQSTQSEISVSSSTDMYSSKRSSIIDPDTQLGILEIDPYAHTKPDLSAVLDHIIVSDGELIERSLPHVPQTEGQLGVSLVMDGVQLEQDIRDMTITQVVHDTQLSDLSGSERSSRKTSFISDRSTELDGAVTIIPEAQTCVSDIILSKQPSAEPFQQQQTNVQGSPSLGDQTLSSQVMLGASQTPNQQYTPENTIMPAVDQQALLFHPRLSQQNSLEKDRYCDNTRLFKMCLSEQYSKVSIGKQLCHNFPTQSDLKKGDGLSPLFFNFSLEYRIRKVWENEVGLKPNGKHRHLAYTDGVNVLQDSIDTINENTETLMLSHAK
jgi:hypothetical protein